MIAFSSQKGACNKKQFECVVSYTFTLACVDHAISTVHNLKWDHFVIIATGRSDHHCSIKETLFIRDLQQSDR